MILSLLSLVMVGSCRELEPEHGPGSVNWFERVVNSATLDSLVAGETYLSIYSQIYSSKEKRTHDLTATVSARNTNILDSVYIEKVEYYDTSGQLIKTYIDQPVFIAPMETVEIVLSEDDLQGGTGANFLFYWKKKERTPEPYFEGVMISTSGQQGISFTTQGRRIK
ncbi:Protein of unknown function [Reichenbachiella faecimaris]|uniref:DUF3124 domain-containing protein n=1 Tax=Reichenbachiella faecimaris TaxID=692418 RepID=A0A1W2GE58_REIFA|nr:DUF3124 domain-containing protein [Reichenbachiella faecimaris]SMD34618.1 Protein of unknown function [Reichenbachiella faecimaris]